MLQLPWERPRVFKMPRSWVLAKEVGGRSRSQVETFSEDRLHHDAQRKFPEEEGSHRPRWCPWKETNRDDNRNLRMVRRWKQDHHNRQEQESSDQRNFVLRDAGDESEPSSPTFQQVCLWKRQSSKWLPNSLEWSSLSYWTTSSGNRSDRFPSLWMPSPKMESDDAEVKECSKSRDSRKAENKFWYARLHTKTDISWHCMLLHQHGEIKCNLHVGGLWFLSRWWNWSPCFHVPGEDDEGQHVLDAWPHQGSWEGNCSGGVFWWSCQAQQDMVTERSTGGSENKGGSTYSTRLNFCLIFWRHKSYDTVHFLTTNLYHFYQGKEKVEGLSLEGRCDDAMTHEHFSSFRKLRLLQLVGTKLAGDFEHLLPKLKLFSWRRCPPEVAATNLSVENLVVFDLSWSVVSENWVGWSLIQVKDTSTWKIFLHRLFLLCLINLFQRISNFFLMLIIIIIL